MELKTKKVLTIIAKILLFILCLQPASYFALWYVCKIRLRLEEVKPIDSPAIGLLVLGFAIVLYCVAIAMIKLVIKAYKSIRK